MRSACFAGIAILAGVMLAFAAAVSPALASDLITVPSPCAQYAREMGALIPNQISPKQADAARARLANASVVDERARNCRAALARALRGAK